MRFEHFTTTLPVGLDEDAQICAQADDDTDEVSITRHLVVTTTYKRDGANLWKQVASDQTDG